MNAFSLIRISKINICVRKRDFYTLYTCLMFPCTIVFLIFIYFFQKDIDEFSLIRISKINVCMKTWFLCFVYLPFVSLYNCIFDFYLFISKGHRCVFINKSLKNQYIQENVIFIHCIFAFCFLVQRCIFFSSIFLKRTWMRFH